MAARILFVTGKGGTGKTSVASALASEAARRRIPALLVHMPSSRSRAARPASPAPSRRPRPAKEHGVDEVVLDEARDLGAFLTRVVGLAFIARRLQDSRTFMAVAAAAPGLRDLVSLTSITARAARRRGVVVVDAPASGHSLPLLTSPSRLLEVTPVGPVAREARAAAALLADPAAFTAILVATPEELAITEALELERDVVAAGVPRPRLVVNGLWPAYVGRQDGERLLASGVSTDAAMHWKRHCRQLELVESLEKRAGPCARIAFRVEGPDTTLPRDDVAALFDDLADGAAGSSS